MDTLSVPIATAEFVALDVETNGRAGVLCEMTEVGAVLVGGGELHESFESLVRVERPLSRERLTAARDPLRKSRRRKVKGLEVSSLHLCANANQYALQL